MRKLAIIAAGLLLTGCTVRSDAQQAALAKLLADGEQVAIHEVPQGPTQVALCIAFETASAQIGVTLHPPLSPVPVATPTPSK